MSPRNQGVFQLLKEVTLRRILAFCSSRKWDYFKPTLKHSEIESFNSRFRDELLNRELFLSNDELRYVADRWQMDYNHCRPHSSLNYFAPAAFTAICLEQGFDSLCLT